MILLAFVSFVGVPACSQTDWPTYGHDPGGLRYSPLKQIDRTNIAKLKVAWVYHLKPSSTAESVTTPRSMLPNRDAGEVSYGQQRVGAQDEISLPSGKGRDITNSLCSTCHTTDIFVR